MDNFINEMAERVGIDQATAHKVVDFIQENIHRLPELLQGEKGGDAGGGLIDSLKDQFGGLLDGK